MEPWDAMPWNPEPRDATGPCPASCGGADVPFSGVLQYVPVEAGYEAKDGENVLDSIDVPAEAK